MFQIDLASDGELQLILPTGRSVTIEASPEGVAFVRKIILDYRRQVRDQPRYIGTLPTQAAVDKFLAEKKIRTAREEADRVKEKASKLGVDLDKLELRL